VAGALLVAPTATAAPAAPPAVPGAAPVAASPVAAAAAARRAGTDVEALSERSETARTFARPDGSFTTEVYALPQRVRRPGAGDHGWVPVDTTLRANADGTISPVATPAALTMSGGGTGPLVTLARDGRRIGLTWPAPLPEPVLAGDTATYAEVLPGVDLRVTATIGGYRQVLVVKNRAAAAQPALRRVRLGLVTAGVRATVTDDGALLARAATGGTGGTAKDGGTAKGTVVFAADPPMMWDSPAAPARAAGLPAGVDPAQAATPTRRARMPLRLADGELTVTPDRALLADPAASYPLIIDPAAETVWSGDWTHINETFPNQSNWTTDRGSGAKVGYSNWESPTVKYRSFFLFGFGGWQGRTITGAVFQAELDHSASCSNTPTDLYQTANVSRSQSITWNNSSGGGTWHTWLAQASGKANASCGQGNALMEWGNVAGAAQGAANAGGQLTLGLRAPNEGDRNQWKKFVPAGVRLAVNWNAPPNLPAALSTVPPTPCGPQAAPTALNTATPSFSAQVSDPHLDNVTGNLEIRENGALVHGYETPLVASGSVVAWPAVPAGKLPVDQPDRIFSYEARASDWALTSAWTARCYFTVDTVIPGTPAVESADFPDGEPVLQVGQVGTLALGPGVNPQGQPDTDVSGYRYGFQQDKLTGWVAADADGRATLPMVLWNTGRTLYVQAVDRAGNPSLHDTPCVCTSWDLRARAGSATPSGDRGDVNGDGLADVSTTVDLGYGRTAAWTLVSKAGGGFHPQPYLGWDAGLNGGFDGYRIRQVSGDFTGDGLSDIALFRDDPDTRLRLFLLRSDAHRYDAPSTPLWEGPAGSAWRINNIQPVGTDADGDGKLDLAIMLRLGASEFSLNVLRNTTSGATAAFAAPAEWWRNPVGWAEPQRMKVIGGDFNGDGKGDIAHFYNYDGALTRLWVHTSTGTAFGAGAQVWDSGAGNWEWGRSTFVTGDFTGDGRTDIVGMYDYTSFTRMFIWPANATGFGTPTYWWDGAPAGSAFLAGRAELSAGDFDGDGRDDVAAVYDATAAGKVYAFLSNATGTGAVSPDLAAPPWSGRIGAVVTNVTPETGRQYRLVAAHSGKCVDLTGAGTGDTARVQQFSCLEPGGNQKVTFERVGGSAYYQVKFVHSGKCLDVEGLGRGDGQIFQQYTCQGNGNQQFRLEYLAGTGLDVQVRVRAAHSDKCLGISGGSQGDTAPAVQWSCVGGPGTDHAYHVRIQP
jgi:hypothetical protein